MGVGCDGAFLEAGLASDGCQIVVRSHNDAINYGRNHARFRPTQHVELMPPAQVSRAVMVSSTGTDRAVVTKIESRASVVERL